MTKMALNVILNVSMFFPLIGFSDRLPAFGDSFGLELKSHCARPLLYETEPHQLRLQHNHHEPACGGCVGESWPLLSVTFSPFWHLTSCGWILRLLVQEKFILSTATISANPPLCLYTSKVSVSWVGVEVLLSSYGKLCFLLQKAPNHLLLCFEVYHVWLCIINNIEKLLQTKSYLKII